MWFILPSLCMCGLFCTHCTGLTSPSPGLLGLAERSLGIASGCVQRKKKKKGHGGVSTGSSPNTVYLLSGLCSLSAGCPSQQYSL